MPIDATPPGDPAPSTPAKTPPHTPIPGNLVTLEPISPAHSPSLFKHLGGPANAPLWTYLFHHAPATQAEMDTMVAEWVPAPDGPPPEFQMYAVMPRAESSSGADVQQQPEALGVVAYLNNVPAHRRIEVGFIALGTRLQRTRAATEALYLLIQRPFDDELGYRRVEWKANSRNAPSLAAAERLGFVYEGVFRKHIIVKGIRRDTTYFSITDDEWPRVKQALVAWLDDANFDAKGVQKKSLKELRNSAS